MVDTVKIRRRVNGVTGAPAANAGTIGELAANCPNAAGSTDLPALFVHDGSIWRELNPLRNYLLRTGDDIADYGEAAHDLGAALSGAANLSLANGMVQFGTMTADTTFTLQNPTGHASTSILLLLDTGGFSPTFTGVTWKNDNTPLGTAGVYLMSFFLINGAWQGVLVQ